MHPTVIKIRQKLFWEPLLLLYQVFGLNPFSVAILQNRQAKNIFLLAFHSTTIAIIMLNIVYTLNFHIPAAKTLRFGMDLLLTMSILIAHLVTVIEVMVARQHCIDLTIRIGQIFLMFATVPLDHLRSWYLRKCWLTCLLVVVVKCIGALWFWNPLFLPVFLSWHVIHVRCIQISMYVDILSRLLNRLNVEIKEENGATVVQRLVKAKIVYAAVQQTNRIICRTFGLSLIVIVSEYIVELTNCVYWILVSIFAIQSLRHLISKL